MRHRRAILARTPVGADSNRRPDGRPDTVSAAISCADARRSYE